MSVLALMCLAVMVLGQAAVNGSPGPLVAYVAKDDDSFRWIMRRKGTVGPASWVELTLSSQTWRDVVWKHQLFIVKPSTMLDESRQALLVIAGGDWKIELEEPTEDVQIPHEAGLFARMAEGMKTPVAVLLQVPHQPMFEGKREDQIIALTFDEFLKTGDPDWPLLLPMVKSAVRAMDAVQAFARDHWSLEVETFTVCGASKRGWTTWLSGAVDRRVKALVPIVIDMLKMGTHLKHQVEVWGEVSYKIQDYTHRDLPKKLDTERGRALQQIIDPYAYIHLLTQPKLIMVGTNDHYWPLDALNLYWEDLVGPKYILYVANNGHGLQDLTRVVGSLHAFHQHAAHGTPLPKLEWDFKKTDGVLALRVTSDLRPLKVDAWVAASMTHDFRHARWQSFSFTTVGDAHVYEMAVPKTGYAALFGEAVFNGEILPYFLSTNVQIVMAEKT